MQAWLYQMVNRGEWSPGEYRTEVWEGADVTWPAGRVVGIRDGGIEPGDLVVFYFTTTQNDEPGIYGWGVIQEYLVRKKEIRFRVSTPSDHLKMDPIWSPAVQRIVDRVRGTVKQGTMWRMGIGDLRYLRRELRPGSSRR